mgnify:FL=1
MAENRPNAEDAGRSDDADATMNDDADATTNDGDSAVTSGAVASSDASDASDELPEAVVEEADRLTRLAEEAAVDDAEAAYRERRDDLVEDHDFVARVREEDDTLVLYPEEWIKDGVVQFDEIEDTDRAAEVSLSGPDLGADWEAVEEANQAIVEAVEAAYGPDHAANVRVFADFMGNHYLKRVDDATADERAEFLTEYYPRNAWPSKEQESIVAESVALVDDVGDEVPGT